MQECENCGAKSHFVECYEKIVKDPTLAGMRCFGFSEYKLFQDSDMQIREVDVDFNPEKPQVVVDSYMNDKPVIAYYSEKGTNFTFDVKGGVTVRKLVRKFEDLTSRYTQNPDGPYLPVDILWEEEDQRVDRLFNHMLEVVKNISHDVIVKNFAFPKIKMV